MGNAVGIPHLQERSRYREHSKEFVTYGILYGTLEVAVCDEIPNVLCKL